MKLHLNINGVKYEQEIDDREFNKLMNAFTEQLVKQQLDLESLFKDSRISRNVFPMGDIQKLPFANSYSNRVFQNIVDKENLFLRNFIW